jgi:site-specific recombinase XerC
MTTTTAPKTRPARRAVRAGSPSSGSAIVVAPTGLEALTTAPAGDPRQIVAAFIDRRSENTKRAIHSDLLSWQSWLSEVAGIEAWTLDDAAAVLAAAHPIRLRELVLAFGRWQRDAGLTVATALRRISTLRSLVGALRRAGCTSNALDLDPAEVREHVGRRQTTRDTTGPGLDGTAALLRAAAAQADPALAARDSAILWLLVGIGLRRFEVSGLEVDHLELDGDRPRVSILGKARDDREWMSLPDPACAAIRAWLDIRPTTDSRALFVTLDTRSRGRPIGASAVYSTMRRLAAAAGFAPGKVRPHGLRHVHGTLAARVTNGDPFKVRTAMRHASVSTSQHYVDQEADTQGKVAGAVAAMVAAAV